jgi:hypothetical protein
MSAAVNLRAALLDLNTDESLGCCATRALSVGRQATIQCDAFANAPGVRRISNAEALSRTPAAGFCLNRLRQPRFRPATRA